MAHLNNLVSYMAFAGVSEPRDGSPGELEKADWTALGDELAKMMPPQPNVTISLVWSLGQLLV